jgi:flagellar M-ring protein FliF
MQRIWNNLTLAQKRILTGMGVVTTVGLGWLIVWASRPEYRPLFTKLTPTSAGAVTKKLKELNVPYRLEDDGSVVLVPHQRVDELRVVMANEKILKDPHVGFDIFDESPLGMTEPMMKIRRQQAAEGELERTISSMEGVLDARVHLVQPEETIWTQDEHDPTASVTLTLAPGQRLTTPQVDAITYLVSHAVEGLSPNKITVMDNHLTLLTGTPDDPDAKENDRAMRQLAMQRRYEEQIRENVQQMLTRVFGPNNSDVRVQAELDFDRTQTQSETFRPIEGNEGVIDKKTEKEETYKGAGAPPPGGAAGATANVSVPANLSRTSNSPNSAYTSRHVDTSYKVTTEKQTTDKAQATLKRQSVSVVVDSLPKGKTKQELEQMITVAAGINRARGDQVNVAVMPFNKSHLLAQKQEMEKARRQQLYATLARSAIMAAIVFIALVVGTRLFAPSPQHREVSLPEPESVASRALPEHPSRSALDDETRMLPGELERSPLDDEDSYHPSTPVPESGDRRRTPTYESSDHASMPRQERTYQPMMPMDEDPLEAHLRQPTPETVFSTDAPPFSSIQDIEPADLVKTLHSEHPQTIALVLSHLPAERAAAVVSRLSPDLRAEVATRIAHLEQTTPEALQRVEQALRQKIDLLQGEQTVGGVKALVEMINRSNRTTEKMILESLEQQSPELAEEVKKHLFTFEDVAKLDDRAIQNVLREVDTKVLSLALKGASDEVKDCFFRNMSQRAASTLQEDMEFMGAVKLRNVEDAQTQVVAAVRRLEETGVIEISQGDEDAFIA